MPLVGKMMRAPSICAGQERWLVYFSLFLDESGKAHQRGYAALCGYVATMDEWARFGEAWAQVQLKWGIPALHMSRIMSPANKDDEWPKIRVRVESAGLKWEDWRDHVLDEFCELIFQSNVASVGAVIDTTIYREMKNSDAEDYLVVHADCNVYLFHHALMRALDIVERVDKTGLMTVCIDDDQEQAFNDYRSYWSLQNMIKVDGGPR